jgi:hypothetical protein
LLLGFVLHRAGRAGLTRPVKAALLQERDGRATAGGAAAAAPSRPNANATIAARAGMRDEEQHCSITKNFSINQNLDARLTKH